MKLLAKIFNLKIRDISDVPFIPDTIDGRPVLVIHKGMAIMG